MNFSRATGNGVELRQVIHRDPEGTPFPSGAERFTSLTLASEDGKPLAECKQAVLALVSSSFNTGLKISREKNKVVSWGKEPVLVTRVGATIVAPCLQGLRWKMIDFNEKVLAEGTVGADGLIRVPVNKAVWLTELNRP